MTMTIALAGKGGTGKTTVAALLIRYLTGLNRGTVLAIDADPSANLNMALGLPLEETIGDIREGMLAQVAPDGSLAGSAGMSKFDYLDYQIEYALVEGPQVDLLAMGRPEGQGCYCPVNHMLREIIDRLGKSYDFVVIDNEAGMEHLSRRTTRDVDYLLLVTDPTQRGLIAAQRMAEMVPGLNIGVKNTYLVVNRLRGEMPPPLALAVEATGVELLHTVPDDPAIAEFEFDGRPLVELPAEAAVSRAVREIGEKIVLSSQQLAVSS